MSKKKREKRPFDLERRLFDRRKNDFLIVSIFIERRPFDRRKNDFLILKNDLEKTWSFLYKKMSLLEIEEIGMDIVEKLKVTGTEVVVQDNKLVDSPRMFSLQEQKLFLFLVSKLDPNKQNDVVFRISISEFAKAIGINSMTDVYRDVRKIVKQLMSRVISIKCLKDDLSQTIKDIHIISYAEYWHGKGFADIKISEEIAPYLFDLKKEYTLYKLSQITALSSIYAIRIYEMLKKQERIGNRTFFIDELREKLAIKDQQYARVNDFRLKVLEIAKREINAKTDIKIDFRFIKSGRKITAIQFNIKSRNANKKEENRNLYLFKSEASNDQNKHLQEIMDFGFSEKSASGMIDNLSDDEVENAVWVVKKQIEKGNVKNPKAMIRTALKEKWRIDKIDYKKRNTTKEQKKLTPTPVSKRSTLMKLFDSFFRR